MVLFDFSFFLKKNLYMCFFECSQTFTCTLLHSEKEEGSTTQRSTTKRRREEAAPPIIFQKQRGHKQEVPPEKTRLTPRLGTIRLDLARVFVAVFLFLARILST